MEDKKGKGKERQDSVHTAELEQEKRNLVEPRSGPAGRKLAWEYKQWYAIEKQSNNTDTYQVPPINRPPSNLRIRCVWPRRNNWTLVAIPELQDAIHKLRVYSEKMEGEEEWRALQPDYWLPMLESMCRYTQKIANNERTAMQRDLNYYRKLFPHAYGAVLRWPMKSQQHWYRYEVSELMVD
jgi:hypothetical protein